MIKIKNISKNYGNLRVLDKINLMINKGEFITIFGPNGCGKTTLLNILAGIEECEGEITKDSRLKLAVVFQNYNESLFPWKNIYDNIILNTKNNKKAKELINHLDLKNFLEKYPYQLSGGMQQKVAIARAFTKKPDIILLDEPFSSLDYHTSRNLISELADLCNKEKVTTVLVSHDIDEAILLADRMIILSKKPSKIKAEIKIDLPKPRKLDLIQTKEFNKIRNKVLKITTK